LSNILAQKKEIKRLEKTREQESRDALEEEARQNAEAQERAIREFELTQAGLDVKSGRASQNPEGSRNEENRSPFASENGQTQRGEKRKFSLDEDEVARIALEERTKARKAIDDEKV
jgi:nitric oxide synthase-interacting protein